MDFNILEKNEARVEVKSLTYRPAKSQDEVEAALHLAAKYFKTHDPSLSLNYQAAMTKAAPNSEHSDFVIALCEEEVVGVIRLFKKTFSWTNGPKFATCFSIVCIDERFRGRGLSKPLIEAAERESLRIGADFCYLIARRSVDYYYNQFNYFGLSCYESIEFSSKHSFSKAPKIKYELAQKMLASGFEIYQRAYDHSYANCLGKTIRSLPDWNLLFERLKFLGDVRFFNWLNKRGDIVGYFIVEGSTIAEIAALPNEDIYSLFFALKNLEGITKTRIPREHRLLSYSELDEVTYSRRTCTYGGHMVKTLRTPTVSAKEAALALGIRLEGFNESIECNPFNLAFADIL